MALNQFGLGLTLTTKDQMSAALGQIRNSLRSTRTDVDNLTNSANRGRDALGRFTKGTGSLPPGGVVDAQGRFRDSRGRFLPGGGKQGGLAGEASATTVAFEKLGAAGAALGGGAFLAGASEASGNYGEQLARIRTVIDETELSTEAARKATLGLNETFGFGPIAQADALYETLSAGITDATEAIDILTVANKFAIGGKADLATSIDVLTSSVNIYKDANLTATQAADMMFTAINAGKTTASQLSRYLGEVTPTAHAAGVSFGELQAAIGAMTASGIRTPQAMTGLNAILSNLMKPSKEAADEAQRLGIEFGATAVKTRGLKGVLDQLINNPGLKDNSLSQLFGSIDGSKVAFSLTSDEMRRFTQVMGMMNHSVGATDKAMNIMMNTVNFQKHLFKGLKEQTLITVGEAFEKLEVSVLKFANNSMRWFNNLAPPLRQFLTLGVSTAAATMAFAGALSVLGPPLKAAIMLITGGLTPLGLLRAGLLLLPAALTAAKSTISDLGSIGGNFGLTIERIGMAWDGLIQLFTKGRLSQELTQEFLNGDNAFLNFAIKIKQTVDNIKNFFKGIFDGFMSGLEKIRPQIDLFDSSVKDLKNAFGLLNDPITNVDAGFEKAGKSGKVFGGALSDIAGLVLSTISTALNLITGFTKESDKLGSSFKEVIGSSKELGTALGDVFLKLSGNINGVAESKDAWQGLGGALAGRVADSFKLISASIKGITNLIKNLSDVITGISDVLGGVFTGDWKRIMAGFRNITASSIKTVIDLIMGAGGIIGTVFDSIGRTFGKDLGISKNLEKARQFADSFVDKTFMNVSADASKSGSSPTSPGTFKGILSPATAMANLETSIASPAVNTATMPVLAAQIASSSQQSSGVISELSRAAAIAAAQAAMSALPPAQINAELKVNEDVLGKVIMSATLSNANRSGVSVPVDIGY